LYTQKKAAAEEQGASHDVPERYHDCVEDWPKGPYTQKIQECLLTEELIMTHIRQAIEEEQQLPQH